MGKRIIDTYVKYNKPAPDYTRPSFESLINKNDDAIILIDKFDELACKGMGINSDPIVQWDWFVKMFYPKISVEKLQKGFNDSMKIKGLKPIEEQVKEKGRELLID